MQRSTPQRTTQRSDKVSQKATSEPSDRDEKTAAGAPARTAGCAATKASTGCPGW
jgi:hypothetical protein